MNQAARPEACRAARLARLREVRSACQSARRWAARQVNQAARSRARQRTDSVPRLANQPARWWVARSAAWRASRRMPWSRAEWTAQSAARDEASQLAARQWAWPEHWRENRQTAQSGSRREALPARQWTPRLRAWQVNRRADQSAARGEATQLAASQWTWRQNRQTAQSETHRESRQTNQPACQRALRLQASRTRRRADQSAVRGEASQLGACQPMWPEGSRESRQAAQLGTWREPLQVSQSPRRWMRLWARLAGQSAARGVTSRPAGGRPAWPGDPSRCATRLMGLPGVSQPARWVPRLGARRVGRWTSWTGGWQAERRVPCCSARSWIRLVRRAALGGWLAASWPACRLR